MAKDIWLISDTHFNHSNIIKYCDRPFKSSEEMDWHMVECWNSVVKPGDKVYHLGDVYFGGKDYVDNLLSHLHGHKRLILGNHDDGKDPILHKHFRKIDVWRMFTDHGVLLSHVPLHRSALFRGGKGVELLNVHGHIHTNPSPVGPYECVCVEQINYTPVHIEDYRAKKSVLGASL